MVVAGFTARKPSLIQSARNVYRRLHRSQAGEIPCMSWYRMPMTCNLATRKATAKRRYLAEDEHHV